MSYFESFRFRVGGLSLIVSRPYSMRITLKLHRTTSSLWFRALVYSGPKKCVQLDDFRFRAYPKGARPQIIGFWAQML